MFDEGEVGYIIRAEWLEPASDWHQVCLEIEIGDSCPLHLSSQSNSSTFSVDTVDATDGGDGGALIQ